MEDSTLLILQADFMPLVLAITIAFGLLIGSFLNVVIHRLPIMLDQDWQNQANLILNPGTPIKSDQPPFNLLFPNSHCPSCNVAIKPWQNIPIVSYLILGGKCANCHSQISLRYPLVELCTALVSALVIYKFGITVAGSLALIFSWILICLTMIDYDHQLLPDDMTLPLLWLGLLGNSFGLFVDLPAAVWGAALGYLLLWSLFWAFKLLTGKEGMGFGDFKLLAALGAWMGWQALPLIIILSSLSGALLGGYLVLRGRDRNNPIPFGPYLAIAGWVTLMWGEQLSDWYLQLVLGGA
jgi:leader peptidase (prepilin peptidase)/N-methyltransferase